jgi:acyl-coenzyme A synthetase/AMP-(fatty) acid ligase
MLFESWLRTVARNSDAIALRDAITGGTHSFSGVQRALDALPRLEPRSLHVASIGGGVLSFVLQTLRAWRDDAVLCPVERDGANVPDITGLPREIAHLKLTSGSTGEPRCVMFRAEQLAADAENIRTSMSLDAACPNLTVISAAHSYGFSNLVLPLLLQGHAMVTVPDALPASLRAAFALHHRFTLPAVPAMWRAWWQAGVLYNAPLALAISAGAPLPLEVEHGIFDGTGLKIHNFYGSSECGGIAYDRSGVPRSDASLAGTVMNGVKLDVNAEGCLTVEGCNVGEGYWPRIDDALCDGRFTTSDLADVRDGAVFMRGRVSDSVNIAGRKLNPADVEAALLSCAAVRHCVVFGVPSADASRCEEAVACINVCKEITERELRDVVASLLPSWQVPRQFWFCNTLEPDARGKFPRAAWRQKWREAQAPAANRATGQ